MGWRWGRLRQGQEYQEKGIVGGHIGGWSPQSTCRNQLNLLYQIIQNAEKTLGIKIVIKIILIIVTIWNHNIQQNWSSKLWHSYSMEYDIWSHIH